jgi:hypothetical protein
MSVCRSLADAHTSTVTNHVGGRARNIVPVLVIGGSAEIIILRGPSWGILIVIGFAMLAFPRSRNRGFGGRAAGGPQSARTVLGWTLRSRLLPFAYISAAAWFLTRSVIGTVLVALAAFVVVDLNTWVWARTASPKSDNVPTSSK